MPLTEARQKKKNKNPFSCLARHLSYVQYNTNWGVRKSPSCKANFTAKKKKKPAKKAKQKGTFQKFITIEHTHKNNLDDNFLKININQREKFQIE